MSDNVINYKHKAALYFKEQCVGGYSGHMATIPHNPNIQSFMMAFAKGAHFDNNKFAEFLEEMASSLREIANDRT